MQRQPNVFRPCARHPPSRRDLSWPEPSNLTFTHLVVASKKGNTMCDVPPPAGSRAEREWTQVGGGGWGDGRSRYLGGWVGRRIMRGNISAWRGMLGFPRAADKTSVQREGSGLRNVVCSAHTLHLILMDAARNSQPGRWCECDGGLGCVDQELHVTLRGAFTQWRLSFGVFCKNKNKNKNHRRHHNHHHHLRQLAPIDFIP